MGKHKKTAKSNLIFDGLVNLVMILVLLVCLLPFIYMVAMSLSDPAAIMNKDCLL